MKRTMGEDMAALAAALVAVCPGLGLAQSMVSKHLACLRDCGLVTSAPLGRTSLFRLAAVETVLAATGNALALRLVWASGCCREDEQ